MKLPDHAFTDFAGIKRNFDALVKSINLLIGQYTPAISTLPTAPYPGQIIIFQNAAMATVGTAWQLRYNADSGSAYKWEFIGGPPLFNLVDASESTTSVTYADLATAGPSLTNPLAGEYLVDGFARWAVNSASNNQHYASLKVGAATPNDTTDMFINFMNDNSATTFRGASGGKRTFRTLTAASTVLKMQYRTTNGGSPVFFEGRSLTLTPVRVG